MSLGLVICNCCRRLAIQGGKNTDMPGPVSTDTMRISMMHRHADQNMPVFLTIRSESEFRVLFVN